MLLASVVAVLGVASVLLVILAPGTSAPDALDPKAFIWRREPVSIAGGVFEIRQLAPLDRRVVAIASGPFDDALVRNRGLLISSADGVTWEPADGPIAAVSITAVTTWKGAAWAFGQVAGPVDVENQVWRSADGTAWTKVDGVTGMDFGLGGVSGLAGSEAAILATAFDRHDAESGDFLLLRSENGRDWVPVRQPRGPSYGLRSMTHGPAGFVVLFAFEDDRGAQFGEAWHSVDGLRWTQHPIAGPEHGFNLFDVAGGPAGFAAVGITIEADAPDFKPTAWVSANGEFWQRATIVDASEPIAGMTELIVPVGTGYLAFGRAGPSDVEMVAAAWTSSDGLQWTRSPSWPVSMALDEATGAVRWGERIFVNGQAIDGDGAGHPVVWIGELGH